MPVHSGLFAFAILIMACGGWLLVPELVRPGESGRLETTPEAREASASRSLLAARLGAIRGDLWADAAMILVAALPGVTEVASGEAFPRAIHPKARVAAERAVRLAPYDPTAWFAFAAVLPAARATEDGRGPTTATLLEMAFLTGPDDEALRLPRAALAVRTDAIAAAGIRDFVARDLYRLAARADRDRVFAVLYGEATPIGKLFLERVAVEIDPALRRAMTRIAG
ncbi:hypothetical protein RHODGE_RHODGE_03583 [Rhodoplanes serenus]|uniref:Uncharacterized protein n=1 Tax=Rhodoplanes serenus TaxID=200615 RepID=A0A3S4FEL0_9BRAD|nr:hypothetical protein [Rhodoplanes serenus]VCU10393.1 hypothetical protein RHODGE_RHODGE_03583 [Rhodoplanes serenus]